MKHTREFLKNNLDVLLFGAALATVGPLMVWWSILVRRTLERADDMMRMHIEQNFAGAEKTQRLAQLTEESARRMLMVVGESSLAGLLLCVLAGVLFWVARKRRQEALRLQTMVQLSTHQLKTPLAGVRALLQSLGRGSIPPEAQSRLLRQGIAECDRLEHMVETHLAYQRAMGRENFVPEVADAAQLVSDILQHRRASFPEEEIQFESIAPAQLECDTDGIRVVLENLLDNARKYGGGRVSCTDALDDNLWLLRVCDQGQGFSPSEAESLFEPFERGTKAGVSHGSGLGLYLSRKVMRKMKGDLEATSLGQGKGACFTLRVPVARKTS